LTAETIAYYGSFIAGTFSVVTLVLAFQKGADPQRASARLAVALALSVLVAAFLFVVSRPNGWEGSAGAAMGTVVICAGAAAGSRAW
jgi:hypothetical protein